MQPSTPPSQNQNPAAQPAPYISLHSTTLLLIFFLFCALMTCSGCSESPEQVYHRLDTEAKQYLTDRQYAQAISTWNKLLTLQPDAADIYPNLATAYLSNGQYAQALQIFQEYLTLYPESRETQVNIMKIQLRLFDIAGARASWEKIQAFPADPTSLTLHGDLLVTLEQYKPAIEEYRKALTLNPAAQTALARLAVTLQGQDKKQEAAAFYHKLEAQHPTNPEILLQMGNYWLLTGDTQKTELFLREAIDRVPENQDLRVQRAQLYIQSSRFSKAADIFQQLCDQNPANRFYKKMLLESLLLGEQFSRTGTLLTALSEAENQDVDFLILKGKYYLNTGKYLVAVSQLELALEKEPRSPLAHYLLALAHMAGGQNNLGQKYLVRSLSLNPNFIAAELTLADYYYKTGDYDLALEHVNQVLQKEPENFRAFLIQGNLFLARKEYNAALNAFHNAYILNPAIPAPVYFTGVLASFTKKTEQALALYSSLTTRHPLLADATLLYAQLLSRQGHHNQALRYLQDSTTAHPYAPYLHHISGLILLSAGRQQDAIEAFKSAIALAPNMKESYLQLFTLYKRNPDRLEKILVKAINRINNFEEAQIRLATLYSTTRRPEQAVALLQKALANNPTSPVLANNLAWLYLEYQPDNMDETMRLASLAYDNCPNNGAVADTLGWVYYKKHIFTRAGWLLEEAATLEPDNPLILYHLAVVQIELDKKTLALKNLTKAKDISTDQQLRENIERQLRLVTSTLSP